MKCKKEGISGHGAEVSERLRFEQMISDLSARFIDVLPDKLDSEIELALKSVLEFFQVDRCALLRILPNQNAWEITHSVYSENTPTVPTGTILPRSIHPWAFEKLVEKAEMLSFARVDEMPDEANVDKQTWRDWGIRSNLVIPLSIKNIVAHIIAINAVAEERRWPDTFIPRLRLFGEILVNALERRKAEQALRDSEERLNLAATSASAVLWELDCSSHTFWATEKAREIFGYEPEEIISMERFEASVHPYDLEHVQEAINRALEENEPIDVEYRIQSDNKQRWILSRGRTHYTSAGNPDRILGISCDISERKQLEHQLRSRMEEIDCLRQELERENIYLREEIEVQGLHEEIVGRSPEMRRALSQLEQVAPTDTTVLLTGETGTGKELLAQAVHRLSARKHRPLVTVNCASLPPTLVESELFGRERGAYTGAMTRMTGRFEAADKATLFLDEIGELPIEVQAKLLRVLEQGCFERLGSARTKQVDVRIIAATNHDLERRVSEGKFRKDLFFRLNVFPIHIPPLRERAEDIPALVWAFIRQFERKMGKRIDSISRRCMKALQCCTWPGNVRELKNEVERSMIVCNGRTLDVCLPNSSNPEDEENLHLEEAERKHIIRVLKKTGWRLSGRGGAAEILGLKRTTLQGKMKKLGIKRPSP